MKKQRDLFDSARCPRWTVLVVLVLSAFLLSANSSRAEFVTGLQLYSSMDTIAAGVVPDDYDSHDGTIYGDVEQVTDATRGEVLEMDGEQYVTNEYVDYGNVLDPGAGSYTAVLWFKVSATTAHQRLAGKGMMAQTTNEGWGILLTKTGSLYVRANYNDGDSSARLGVVKSASYDQWHQVALVIDQASGRLKGYLDGLGSGTTGTDNGWSLDFGNVFTPGVDFVSPESLLIGGADKSPLNGRVDDFAIWNRALSDAEILDLYEGADIVPEPSTIALLVGVLVVAGLVRRRR